jgi:hypothetical protein
LRSRRCGCAVAQQGRIVRHRRIALGAADDAFAPLWWQPVGDEFAATRIRRGIERLEPIANITCG